MNLPPILSASVLRNLAAPKETHAMRVTLLNANGPSLYTLRGTGRRKGKYILARDGVSGRHTLDIPASVWNAGIPLGKYGDNPSVAHDLMSKPQPLTPFVVSLVPWQDAATDPTPAADTTSLTNAVETISLRLLEKIFPAKFKVFATPDIKQALERECSPTITAFLKAEGRENVVEFMQTLCTEKPKDAETPAAKRMREKRARDKAAKEALQPV